MSTPKTSAAAIAMLDELHAKRSALVQTIDSAAFRRREFAVAAHLGDDDAEAELHKIDGEEATARSALKNLDMVIGEVEQMRIALVAKEAASRETRSSVELTSTIDELLALDDQCDDALDYARDLLERRETFKREKAHVLKRMPGKMLHAMIGRESEVADAIMSYLDKSLAGHNAGRSYASLTRIAEFDSKYYGNRPSARMLERGPRPLSPFERTFRQAIAPSRGPMEVRQARR